MVPTVPENPDEESFSNQYREPDFQKEENELLNNYE